MITSEALLLASCIFTLLVVPILSQITVLGTEAQQRAPMWNKELQHFPHMGATFYFQYDMAVRRYLYRTDHRNQVQEHHVMAAVQLNPHLATGLSSSQIRFNIDSGGVKSASSTTKMNSWYTVTFWVNFYGGAKPFYGVAVNGALKDHGEMKSIVNRAAADVKIFTGNIVDNNVAGGGADMRSISVYGPNRINLQKGEVDPDAKDGDSIILSTEFVSSGVDVYEVRSINPKKPLELLTSLKLSSRVKNEAIQKDVDLVEVHNSVGMAAALKHRAFSRTSATVKQSYEIPIKVARVPGVIFPFLIEYVTLFL